MTLNILFIFDFGDNIYVFLDKEGAYKLRNQIDVFFLYCFCANQIHTIQHFLFLNFFLLFNNLNKYLKTN